MRMARLGILGLVALAGCNSSTPGVQGNLEFTPTQCGFRLGGCSFEAAVAVGGTLQVEIASLDATPTAGLALVAADPAQLEVVEMVEINNAIAWQVKALGAGRAELVARDADGHDIDSFELDVVAPVSLGLSKVVGQASGPTADGAVELWEVPADKPVSFEIVARGGDKARLMGKLEYTATRPEGAPALVELSGSNPAAGFLYIKPAAGDYDMHVALGGASPVEADVRIHAAP